MNQDVALGEGLYPAVETVCVGDGNNSHWITSVFLFRNAILLRFRNNKVPIEFS
jgi:hypothetical protein